MTYNVWSARVDGVLRFSGCVTAFPASVLCRGACCLFLLLDWGDMDLDCTHEVLPITISVVGPSRCLSGGHRSCQLCQYNRQLKSLSPPTVKTVGGYSDVLNKKSVLIRVDRFVYL